MRLDEFGRVVWLVPAAFGLHVAEEWRGFARWAARHAAPSFTHHDYAVIHLAGLAFSLVIATVLSSWRNRALVFLFLAFFFFPSMFWNVVFHLGATLLFHEYCPGVVTAVAVYPPLVWLVVRASLREGLIAPRLAAAAWVLAGGFHLWEVGHNVFHAW